MQTLCGLWIDPDGRARVTVGTPDGGRAEQVSAFRPFAWMQQAPSGPLPGISVEELKGDGVFRSLAHADTLAAFEAFLAQSREAGPVDDIRPLENQYLLQRRAPALWRAGLPATPPLPARHRDRLLGRERV